MLRALDRFHAGLLKWLAAIGGVLIVVSVALVILNVVSRATGYGPFRFTIAIVEYILLYFTLLAAPYLVRIRGHVMVDFVVTSLRWFPRLVLESAIYLICFAVCVIFMVTSALIMIEAIGRGTFDERSIDIPYWALYCLFPLSFGLMAIEFLRFLFRFDSLYEERIPDEGL
jgi:C4-dicarboxylate transporter, DctQ subunit